MNAYYYFLYRIYRFYTDIIKEKQIPLFYTSCVSAIIVYLNFYTLYTCLIYKNFFKDIIPNKYYVIIPMVIILAVNYFVFVKNKLFLDCNFTKDRRGGILIILYLVISVGLFVTVANLNRGKIISEKAHAARVR